MKPNVMVLNLPSPPGMDVNRDYAGGYGTARLVGRKTYGHTGNLVFPVYLPYVITNLKEAGFKVNALDCQAMNLDMNNTLKAVGKNNPDIIVSMISLPSLQGDLELIDKIKEHHPDIFIATIGTVGKVLPEEVLQKSKVDVTLNGDYPLYKDPLQKLIERLKSDRTNLDDIKGITYLKENKVIANPFESQEKNLDDIDFSAYQMLPMDKYTLSFDDLLGVKWNYFPILSSKGCPFTCTYCPYPLGFGNRITYKSVETIVDEIKYLKKNFGLKAFLFRDQVLTANQDRIDSLCDKIIGSGIDVKFLCETRVDTVTKDILKKLSHVGCNRIHYGVETGDENLLKRIGKPGINREVIKNAFDMTKKEGILTMAHIIIGLPGEDRETLRNTQEFIKELNPDQASFNLITPYPGTKLFSEAKSKGLIITYDWSKYTTDNIVMRTEKLKANELLRVKRLIILKFMLRKRYNSIKRFLMPTPP